MYISLTVLIVGCNFIQYVTYPIFIW